MAVAIRSRRTLLFRIALYSVPLLVALIARVALPSFFEFESQEDTVRTVAMLEKGELPLYGIGHVRFLGAALGPLVYYFKAIPYVLCSDPAGELVWLMLWHLAGILFATLLVREILSEVVGSRQDLAAIAAGCLLALSMHSLGLTSHAHPSNFAATMIPIFAWAVHRWLSTGRPAVLILAGTCVGIMSQLYQLTLFLPVLLVAWCVAWPRLPDRRALLNLLVPVAVCYVPYLLSELATGFFNTRNLFVFSPGPQDDGMVGTSSMAGNFLTLASSIVQYRFLPEALDALWLGLGGVGLVRLLASVRGSKSARFFLVFLPFYTFLPAVVLGAPRYQLSQPAAQCLVVLGGLSVWQGWGGGLFARFLRPLGACRDGRMQQVVSSQALKARLVAAGMLVVPLLVACALLSGSAAGRCLREPAFYPMRVVAAERAARTPSLATSRNLLRLLKDRFGVTLPTLSSRVHSPFAASGHYGHHYLLRVLERSEPTAGSLEGASGLPRAPGESPGAVQRGAPLLVVDDLFPWAVGAVRTEKLGPIEVHELPPGAELPDFERTVDCAGPWCQARRRQEWGPPSVRFFWGCGEFRDLDPEVGVTVEQCEALLEAPPHTRRYVGHLPARLDGPACAGCRDVLWMGASDDCTVTLNLDAGSLKHIDLPAASPPGTPSARHNMRAHTTSMHPHVATHIWRTLRTFASESNAQQAPGALAVDWQHVKERRFGTAVLPPLPPSGGRLVIEVADCVPWYLDFVRFSGVRRAVPEVVRE